MCADRLWPIHEGLHSACCYSPYLAAFLLLQAMSLSLELALS
jgi:hypothetical protein